MSNMVNVFENCDTTARLHGCDPIVPIRFRATNLVNTITCLVRPVPHAPYQLRRLHPLCALSVTLVCKLDGRIKLSRGVPPLQQQQSVICFALL